MAIEINLLLLQLLNGIALGLLYVLVAAGLTVIFGVTDILNFAHGALYMLGAYFGVFIVDVTGNFWLALVISPLLVTGLGLLIERSTLHYLYDRDVSSQILLTFGLTLILTDGVEFFFGSQQSFSTPAALAGPIQIGPIFYPQYKLFVIGAASVVIIFVWALFRFTSFGLITRAGGQSQSTVRLLGIDISKYFTLVFGLGAGLAGVAGVLAAPFVGVNSSMGNDYLLVAFIVVILGGLGSFRGAVIAGMLIGITGSLGEAYFPSLTGFYVYFVLMGTLLIRPQGLFGSYDRETLLEKTAKIQYRVSIDPIPLNDRRMIAVAGILALVPVFVIVGLPKYYIDVLRLMLIWGLLALSLDIVLGYLGLLSFGHAAFFGIAAYVTALLSLHVTNSLLLAFAIGVSLSVIVAWIVGALSIRFTGVFFAMITLAIAQIFYQSSIALTDITGGSSGLSGLPEIRLLGFIVSNPIPFYYITLFIVIAMYCLSVYVLKSSLGQTMEAIREGERRASFLGYDTTLYKRRALALSGGIAGVAGVLVAGGQTLITPNTLHWTISGDALFGVILGGMGTLYGPLLGGAIYAGLQQILSSFFDEWRLLVGLVFVFVVMFAPRGLIGLYDRMTRRLDFGGPGGATPDVSGDSESVSGSTSSADETMKATNPGPNPDTRTPENIANQEEPRQEDDS